MRRHRNSHRHQDNGANTSIGLDQSDGMALALTEGKPIVNTKRVLRVMQQNGLTLQKHTALRPTRTHDGVVVALRSNVRWCSDHLEIHARNGGVVRIVFVIDACDREIIAWSAVANAGISGEMVCDLMIAAVERRFGSLKVPHRLEWLSDNGSAYIARQTAQVSAALGLTLLFTPVRSPQSNGMSEAFVKTLKRDYASTAILPDADTILALLPEWMEDYCEVHPHSGLKFRSPREFLRLIPTWADQNACAQSRMPMEMIFQGLSTSLFHASQQWATISS
jgi:transposase InsO family protein